MLYLSGNIVAPYKITVAPDKNQMQRQAAKSAKGELTIMLISWDSPPFPPPATAD